eukprot:TRINITY_DN2834_c0_g1_i1.p1 TRINITY_DN2834_c0_g1~~TRINITY_DN2834_c0_g1_i1.p1  ORF type:complete len:283 (+),score=47.54 TRINITY_DN2834_c0_g1_i1:82-849(+)
MEGERGVEKKLSAEDEATKERWAKEQEELSKNLIKEDKLDFEFPKDLKLIAGVDISFVKNDEINACAAIIVLTYPEFKVVYEDFEMVQLTEPYIPSFLAFREVPHVAPLINKLKRNHPEFVPQIILVDGNGYLHPRGFGFACHLGVEIDIPTIGIGKNFYMMDGLTTKEVRTLFADNCKKGGDWVPITGKSNNVWGAAFRSHDDSTKPIFVSIGHRISLETAVNITKACCEYRVPEPVRQADLRSRDFIRKNWKK